MALFYLIGSVVMFFCTAFAYEAKRPLLAFACTFTGVMGLGLFLGLIGS